MTAGNDEPNDEVTRRGLEALVAKIHAPQRSEPRAGVVVHQTWRLTGPLGSGKFGVVFAAHNEKLDREDAIKFLAPKHVDDRELRRRFTNETRMLASLQGEHLVRVYDCGEHEGLPYFVMERLRGQTLDARLGSEGLPGREAFQRIAEGILRGLVEAHAQGVVHRDIKPANIMILDDDRVKVLDFGLAMTLEHVESGGTFAGTPRYMAPELLERRARASEVTDVYSVGMVLYQMLTGSVRGEGGEGAAPRRARSEALEAVEVLVRRAIDEDPARRPASAKELLEGLERALAGSEAPRVESTLREVPERRPRSRARWAVAAVGSLFAGGAILIAWPWTAAPSFSEPGGILVTAPHWSSERVDERYDALDRGLREAGSRKVSPARVSRWNAEPERYRQWALEGGAAMALHVSEDEVVRVELSDTLLENPFLALLPSLEHRDLEDPESVELLARLPLVPSGSFDVPRVDPRHPSHAWATFAALLRVAHPREGAGDPYEGVGELAECKGIREGVAEDEKYCAIARYLDASRRASSGESCRPLDGLFEYLEHIGIDWIESGALAMHAECVMENDPEAAALLAQALLDRWPGEACTSVRLFPIMPYLTEETEAERRLTASLATVDPTACEEAAAVELIARRGESYRKREQWAAAAEDFYTAYRRDPAYSRTHLVSWAEAKLRLPLDEDAKEWLLDELRPDTPGPGLEDQQLAIAIAYLRWIVSKDPNDANALLSLYEGLPPGSQPLPVGACSGQRENACPMHQTPCSLDVLQLPTTAKRRVELERSLRRG